MSVREAAFDSFLYAPIGDDRNGMVLTVLSALARLDVDPWVEAADLSRLPRATASARFVSMLESLPGHSSLADRTALAGRLIPLLPARGGQGGQAVGPAPRVAAEGQSSWIHQVSFSLLYFAVLCVGLLIYSEFSDRAPGSLPATAAPAAAATAAAVPGAATASAMVADGTPIRGALPADTSTPHEGR